MLDQSAARAKELREVNTQTCLPRRQSAHGKQFDYDLAVKRIAHPTKAPSVTASEPAYKDSLNHGMTPDGKELWVTCEASASVVVVDTPARQKLLEIPVGGQPNEVCFTPDGWKVSVSSRLDDNVSVVDVAARKVVGTVAVGDEPQWRNRRSSTSASLPRASESRSVPSSSLPRA